ncbi:hypothetical protein FRB96_005880 [Tulasnella sp. 330]|nr:hypothetical protein FRB96_005880 [Tulasnella sp. 330]
MRYISAIVLAIGLSGLTTLAAPVLQIGELVPEASKNMMETAKAERVEVPEADWDDKEMARLRRPRNKDVLYSSKTGQRLPWREDHYLSKLKADRVPSLEDQHRMEDWHGVERSEWAEEAVNPLKEGDQRIAELRASHAAEAASPRQD